ncbi:MAG: tRNA (adenosine(37)-N6)-threonylcarbamoyltransferase complex dimerization subunit type 1 TsaB [Nocardioidaceae bacterium]|nr:MAG: tRNA (adenosine(37)-N6)-threonylcarbamoyltransferase complex dimerization subunit type 1 TsaB [Nocardioidaceae bacterium]
MLLSIDTSTAYVSVALFDADEQQVLAERNDVGPMQHGELLAPTITACLAEAGLVRQDLTAIVVGVGPGPYTGLRVGVVTALALATALEIPAYGVCSLDAIAAACAERGPLVATADARRKELFWAAYEDGRRIGEPQVSKPADIDLAGRPVAGVAHELYPEIFPHVLAPAYPRAADLAQLVSTESTELLDPEPIYLRRPDAVAPGQPKKVS